MLILMEVSSSSCAALHSEASVAALLDVLEEASSDEGMGSAAEEPVLEEEEEEEEGEGEEGEEGQSSKVAWLDVEVVAPLMEAVGGAWSVWSEPLVKRTRLAALGESPMLVSVASSSASVSTLSSVVASSSASASSSSSAVSAASVELAVSLDETEPAL